MTDRTPLSDEQIRESLALAEKATPTWTVDPERPWKLVIGPCVDPEAPGCMVDVRVPLAHCDDWAFAAAAREGWPAALHALQEARTQLAQRDAELAAEKAMRAEDIADQFTALDRAEKAEAELAAERARAERWMVIARCRADHGSCSGCDAMEGNALAAEVTPEEETR